MSEFDADPVHHVVVVCLTLPSSAEIWTWFSVWKMPLSEPSPGPAALGRKDSCTGTAARAVTGDARCQAE